MKFCFKFSPAYENIYCLNPLIAFPCRGEVQMNPLFQNTSMPSRTFSKCMGSRLHPADQYLTACSVLLTLSLLSMKLCKEAAVAFLFCVGAAATTGMVIHESIPRHQGNQAKLLHSSCLNRCLQIIPQCIPFG